MMGLRMTAGIKSSLPRWQAFFFDVSIRSVVSYAIPKNFADLPESRLHRIRSCV